MEHLLHRLYGVDAPDHISSAKQIWWTLVLKTKSYRRACWPTQLDIFRETISRPLGALAPQICTRPTSPINCISSPSWGAWRPHVGLCPIFLVFYVFFAPSPGHTTEPITTHDGSYDVLSTKVVPFEGPRWRKIMFRGSKPPKNVNFGGPNRRFKPNLLNFRLAISSKLQNKSTRNLSTGFRSPVRLREWSSFTTQ